MPKIDDKPKSITEYSELIKQPIKPPSGVPSVENPSQPIDSVPPLPSITKAQGSDDSPILLIQMDASVSRRSNTKSARTKSLTKDMDKVLLASDKLKYPRSGDSTILLIPMDASSSQLTTIGPARTGAFTQPNDSESDSDVLLLPYQ